MSWPLLGRRPSAGDPPRAQVVEPLPSDTNAMLMAMADLTKDEPILTLHSSGWRCWVTMKVSMGVELKIDSGNHPQPRDAVAECLRRCHEVSRR